MQQIREDLDILFRRTTPEIVMKNLDDFFYNGFKAGVHDYSGDTYEHFGQLNLAQYSPDEYMMRYKALKEKMAQSCNGIFSLLYHFAEEVLDWKQNQPVCKFDNVLNWNSVSSRLGQDLFVASWLAHRTFKADKIKKFDWPAIIKTDDNKLNLLLGRGLVENHYHLNGSTQSFSLSWAFLMNHPTEISKRFNAKNLKENLTNSINLGMMDNVVSWNDRIKCAALIRALLFKRCVGLLSFDAAWNEYNKIMRPILASDIAGLVGSLRIGYGMKILQINSQKKCLDYAICSKLYHVDTDSSVRLLSGERSFLYNCFLMQFNGQFSKKESMMFYLYLLIKSALWQEMLQINSRIGFLNFSRYQGRKNQLFAGRVEYWTEAQRLSVCEAFENNHIVKMETRIMSKLSAAGMRSSIRDYDKRILYSDKCFSAKLFDHEKEIPFFYVVHFPKRSVYESGKKNQPRNYKTRIDAERKAKALVRFRKKNPIYATRVLGIDACSNEIGCRPETFATEFRFLRDDDHLNITVHGAMGASSLNPLYVTYHVGEDFLDIADGLRAVDEAILFLPLKRNDRIGHGLVLGTEPTIYYKKKNYVVYMSRQDYLDNCVWLLFRSLEWGIPIEAEYRDFLRQKALELFFEIYGTGDIVRNDQEKSVFDDVLRLYYSSWKIRGDHPRLYKYGTYQEPAGYNFDVYEHYMTMAEPLDGYRKNSFIAYLYHCYHYDRGVREKGLRSVRVEIHDWYIQLMERFQKYLRKKICDYGIYVECNPTSNILIGNFDYYEEHPIYTFSECDSGNNNPKITVSINTDDIGVFGTLLENEYALILSALCRKREREGKYNMQTAYDYLEEIRQNGFEMSFALREHLIRVGEYKRILGMHQ